MPGLEVLRVSFAASKDGRWMARSVDGGPGVSMSFCDFDNSRGGEGEGPYFKTDFRWEEREGVEC